MSFLRRHTPLPMGPPRVHERRQSTASESSTPGLPWRPEDEKFPKTKRTLHTVSQSVSYFTVTVFTGGDPGENRY